MNGAASRCFPLYGGAVFFHFLWVVLLGAAFAFFVVLICPPSFFGAAAVPIV